MLYHTGTWLGVGIHAMQRDPSVYTDPEVSILTVHTNMITY